MAQVNRPASLFRGGYALVAVLVAVVVHQVVTPLPSRRAVLGMRWVVFVGRMSDGLYPRAFRPVHFLVGPVVAVARALLAVVAA